MQPLGVSTVSVMETTSICCQIGYRLAGKRKFYQQLERVAARTRAKVTLQGHPHQSTKTSRRTGHGNKTCPNALLQAGMLTDCTSPDYEGHGTCAG